MKKSIALASIFAVFFAISTALLKPARSVHSQYFQESLTKLGSLPAPAFEVFTFEFKGLVADILFLQTIIYLGKYIQNDENPTKEKWQSVYQLLERIVDLDPHFRDAYILSETMLAWQAGMIEEANLLLEKAAQARPGDYKPLYYIGFNHFYFHKDAKKAAPYLRKAAQIPGAPNYLKGLASRFSLYGSQTVFGILMLEELLASSQNLKTKQYLKERLWVLKMIHTMEKAVLSYKKEYNKLPASLQDLVTSGYLEEVPKDPYGGEFVLLQNGRIYTTSEMIPRLNKDQPDPDKN